jgi:hypothetical protein
VYDEALTVDSWAFSRSREKRDFLWADESRGARQERKVERAAR